MIIFSSMCEWGDFFVIFLSPNYLIVVSNKNYFPLNNLNYAYIFFYLFLQNENYHAFVTSLKKRFPLHRTFFILETFWDLTYFTGPMVESDFSLLIDIHLLNFDWFFLVKVKTKLILTTIWDTRLRPFFKNELAEKVLIIIK